MLKVLKKLLANDLSTFFIKDKSGFSNGPKILPENVPVSPILCNWVFDNFILADDPLVSSLKSWTIFDESFKVTSLPFFLAYLIHQVAN